jgi:hypothetical protein
VKPATGGGGSGAAGVGGGGRGDGHGRPRAGGCCDWWREGTADPLEIAQLASLGGIIFWRELVAIALK